MFSSLLRRTTLVAVVATAAASWVAVGTEVGAVGAGPHSTSLSIRSAHSAVRPGGSDVISGDLRVGSNQALPGKTVTLEAKLAGDPDFLPIGTAVTGPQGGVALTVTPAETTKYQWVFAGDSADNASHSGIATVAVRIPAHSPTRLPSSLSIRLLHPQVTVEGTDAISGRLLSRKTPLRHKIVILVSQADGATGWAFVGAKHTGDHGGVAFVVRPAAATRYRLVFQGTKNFRPARSAVVHVAIRSTALSISVSPASVPSGTSATVSGVLTKTGLPFSGQGVQLWGKPDGSQQKFAALSSMTSGAGGSVSFTVAPTKAMRYYLFFPHTATAPAAKSAARTIAVS